MLRSLCYELTAQNASTGLPGASGVVGFPGLRGLVGDVGDTGLRGPDQTVPVHGVNGDPGNQGEFN